MAVGVTVIRGSIRQGSGMRANIHVRRVYMMRAATQPQMEQECRRGKECDE
jgi:hypothetical protein